MAITFVDAVRHRAEEVGSSLVRAGLASAFDVRGDGEAGLKLSVYRKTDRAPASLTMGGSTEVFLLDLGGWYRDVRTAYDEEDKWEAMDELIRCIEAFVEGDYYEEVYERKGHITARKLYLNVPGGSYAISGLGGLRPTVARLLGYQKLIVRPPT